MLLTEDVYTCNLLKMTICLIGSTAGAPSSAALYGHDNKPKPQASLAFFVCSLFFICHILKLKQYMDFAQDQCWSEYHQLSRCLESSWVVTAVMCCRTIFYCEYVNSVTRSSCKVEVCPTCRTLTIIISQDLSETFPRPQYLLKFWNCQVHTNSNYMYQGCRV